MKSVLAARIRAIPRHAKAAVVRHLPAPTIATNPSSPLAWVAVANSTLSSLPAETRALIENHNLRLGDRILTLFADDIRASAADGLKSLADIGVSPATIALAISEIVRRKTVAQCAYAHRAGFYFAEAEKFIGPQWQHTIWPIIQNEDFTNTLDLACGHGRNSEQLSRYARTIDLVDVNQSCLDACRQRFGAEREGCIFRYHLTDGTHLRTIKDCSISHVYSWDSMVHFDKLVVKNYVAEISRVLKPGGTAFLHHSNLGTDFPNSDWIKNHGSRSDMSAELMQRFARDSGLKIKFQRLSGKADGWGMDDLDCLSLLQKAI